MDYHNNGRFSSTIIRKMNCPAKAKAYLDGECFKKTAALDFGILVHQAILEPDRFDDEVMIAPDYDRRSKKGKNDWVNFFDGYGADGSEIIANPASEWNDIFYETAGIRLINSDQYEKIMEMKAAVFKNETANELLTAAGTAEKTIVWDDDETGLPLQCRPDYLTDEFIIDLKTTADASDRGIRSSIHSFGYHIQQAVYQDGVEHETGEFRPFIFIFVEKEPPYITRCIALGEQSQQKGWSLYRNYIQRLKWCLDHDHWDAYPDNLELELPQYALGGDNG